MIEQVEETICHLDSEVKKTRSVVSTATALTGIAEQLRSKSDEKDAEVRRLTEKSIELRGCITSMLDREEVSLAFCHCESLLILLITCSQQSSQDVQQLRDKLVRDILNEVTKVNQTLEQEKADLVAELKVS